MTDLEKINAYVESHRDEMLETYRKVILQESYHSAPEEVRTMGKMFKEMFEEVGFRCKLTNVGTDESGDMLTGILGEDRPGKPIIFGGHMDTVHKLGSFPCKFEVDDEGKVHGPGVLDMKGGIVIALYVCKALNEIGYNSRPPQDLLRSRRGKAAQARQHRRPVPGVLQGRRVHAQHGDRPARRRPLRFP